jgi:ABC-type transporter Mla MlaB component
MTAFELADWLERDGIALPEDWKAAAMLRKQDAAIKQLREALDRIVEWDAAGLTLLEHHFEKAQAALTATEEYV